MTQLDEATIRVFLAEVGSRKALPASIYLIGGGGLLLLGSNRQTLDIDYVADDQKPGEIDTDAIEVATQMGILLEAVSIADFVPIASGVENRHVYLGQFDKLDAYLFDPYAIAISKLDRGFKTDMEDIMFLLNHGHVVITQLEQAVIAALDQAEAYDLDTNGILARLERIKDTVSPSDRG